MNKNLSRLTAEIMLKGCVPVYRERITASKLLQGRIDRRWLTLRLQHTFLGIAIVEKQPEEVPALLKSAMLKGIADTGSNTPVLKHDIYNDGMPLNTTEEIDGVPMQSSEEKLKTGGSFQQIEDEELHGVPLDGAVLLKCAMLKEMSDTDSRTPVLKHDIYSYEENIEGMPLDTTEHIDGAAAGYAHVFVENRFQMDMLMDLNKKYLREMESAVIEGPVLLEHLANLVPVAAVSATLSNPPKSAVSRPSSAGSLPSKSRKDFFEHKIALPAGGGSTTNIVRIDGR
ncbi:hypothetical protein pipiens_013425 [Culex pipiens pipiens]|uniref:Uncharacterized protein n=1 Tax=Culex pipiens pipiens TaxID=38569 RepID=A0ABD1CYP5_CULPP